MTGRASVVWPKWVLLPYLVAFVLLLVSCRRESHHSSLTSELLKAIEANSQDAVDLILKQGASVNDCDAKGQRPLHVAVALGKTNLVDLLITHGADPNLLGSSFVGGPWTTLEIAVWRGQTNLVAQLIKHGAQVNYPAYSTVTPLHRAVKYNHAGVVRVLLEAGADPEAVDCVGNTSIQIAWSMGREKVQEEFLRWRDSATNSTRQQIDTNDLSAKPPP